MLKQIGYVKHNNSLRTIKAWTPEMNNIIPQTFDTTQGIAIFKITDQKLVLGKYGSIALDVKTSRWSKMEIYNKDKFYKDLMMGDIKSKSLGKSLNDIEINCYGLLKRQSSDWRMECYPTLEELLETVKSKKQSHIITDGKLMLKNKLRKRAAEQ